MTRGQTTQGEAQKGREENGVCEEGKEQHLGWEPADECQFQEQKQGADKEQVALAGLQRGV